MLYLIISLLFTIFMTGGVVLLTTCPSSPVFWIILPFFLVSLLGLIFIGIWRRWFSHRGWKLYTGETPTKTIAYNEKVEVWRSETPQGQGMYCKLDLGRERRLDFIQFRHDTPQISSSETPLKWQMWFYRKDNGYALRYKRPFRPYIETGDPETSQETVAIIVKLNQPILARFIEVKVVEPYEPHYWCIKAIRLRIIIFHYLRYTIGNCILDRL